MASWHSAGAGNLSLLCFTQELTLEALRDKGQMTICSNLNLLCKVLQISCRISYAAGVQSDPALLSCAEASSTETSFTEASSTDLNLWQWVLSSR